MVIEKKPDYNAIIARQDYLDEGGKVCCGHDFWGDIKKVNYGDVILCGACHRYFTKIKHIVWIKRPKHSWYGRYW